MTSPLRYQARGRKALRTGRDAGHNVSGIATRSRISGQFMGEIEDPRMEQVSEIRARLSRDEYEVDPAKVAEAILERLLRGRTLSVVDDDA